MKRLLKFLLAQLTGQSDFGQTTQTRDANSTYQSKSGRYHFGRPAPASQPYISNTSNQNLINRWWSRTFYNNRNLKNLAGGYRIYPRHGYGLIYYYFIKGRIRYIGQTRESSLKWRMTKRQANGNIGYSYAIKRHLLNAFRDNILEIRTEEVRLYQLDQTEKARIQFYAPASQLWNIEHNPYYKQSNRWHLDAG